MNWVIVRIQSFLNICWHPAEIIVSWCREVLHEMLSIARQTIPLHLVVIIESVITIERKLDLIHVTLISTS